MDASPKRPIPSDTPERDIALPRAGTLLWAATRWPSTARTAWRQAADTASAGTSSRQISSTRTSRNCCRHGNKPRGCGSAWRAWAHGPRRGPTGSAAAFVAVPQNPAEVAVSPDQPLDRTPTGRTRTRAPGHQHHPRSRTGKRPGLLQLVTGDEHGVHRTQAAPVASQVPAWRRGRVGRRDNRTRRRADRPSREPFHTRYAEMKRQAPRRGPVVRSADRWHGEGRSTASRAAAPRSPAPCVRPPVRGPSDPRPGALPHGLEACRTRPVSR